MPYCKCNACGDTFGITQSHVCDLSKLPKPRDISDFELPAVVIKVPGCTCDQRTQAQLERVDVCSACVSYFDLDRAQ